MKTFSLKPKDVTRSWYILDASDMPLGRLATYSARLLLGKDKPNVTPHVDGGDYVVIINADRLKVTGGKDSNKTYYRHSGYPGGLSKRSLREQKSLDSTKVISDAVRGMLPANKLKAGRLSRLKVYAGSDHKHVGQNPLAISIEKEDK